MPFTAQATGSVIIGCRLGYWGNIVSGQAWFDDLLISRTDPALDHAPLPQTDLVHRGPWQDAKTSVNNLLANDTDPDGDPLFIAWVSSPTANHGNVTLDGDWIFYTPAASFTGDDSFSYVVSDGRGETTVGTVRVEVNTSTRPSQNQLAVEDQHHGSFRLIFSGIPNRTYTVQESLDLLHWNVLGPATTDQLGLYWIQYKAEANQRFYRSVYP